MKRYTKLQKLIGAFVVGLGTLAACCMTSTFISSLSGALSSSAPRSEQITDPLALTAEMIGLTQTAVSLPTITHTNSPTASASATLASTATLAPTLTLAPTSTVVLITVPPAGGSGGSGGSSGGGSGSGGSGGGGSPGLTPVSGPCPCNGNTMNCSDFRNQKAAQACYDHCKSQGFGDIHRLDRDNDGIACEG